MTEHRIMSPDERAARAALDSPRFLSGADAGRWRLASLEWPIAVCAVSAAPRANAPNEYGLRIDLSGYPQHAPTAEPWCLNQGMRLPPDQRPKGERVGHAFRTDWEEGRALYVPYDRVALSGHPGWPSRHRAYVWHPERDIAFFLGCVHELLNNDDYLGI